MLGMLMVILEAMGHMFSHTIGQILIACDMIITPIGVLSRYIITVTGNTIPINGIPHHTTLSLIITRDIRVIDLIMDGSPRMLQNPSLEKGFL